MHVNIEFCVVWHYEPRAAGLAAAIRDKYPQAAVSMEPAGGGRFEVTLDGAPIFEKSKLGRHERPGEILTLIAERLARQSNA